MRSMAPRQRSLTALGISICVVVLFTHPVNGLAGSDAVSWRPALASSSRSLQTIAAPANGVQPISAGQPQLENQAAHDHEDEMQLDANETITSAITIVNSANDLFNALITGARHVDLRSHIDLSERNIYDSVDWNEPLLPDVLPRTTSITGTCSTAPDESFLANVTGVQLLPLKSNMCLILADADVFPVRHGNLWLDNLYMRATSGASVEGARDDVVEMLLVKEAGKVWMSNVIMQGNGSDTNVAMDVFRHIHAEDCVFADFGPRATPMRISGAEGTGVFERCRFKASEDLAEDAGPPEAMVRAVRGASIQVKNCTLQNPPGQLSSMFQSDVWSHIYSDKQMGVASIDRDGEEAGVEISEPMIAVPTTVPFLSGQDEWVLQIRNELRRPSPGGASASGGDGTGTSLTVGITAGVAVSVVLAAIIVALVLAILRMKRNTRNAAQEGRGFEQKPCQYPSSFDNGNHASPVGSTFPACDDVLGSYGGPRTTSPKRGLRGSDTARSMMVSTASWQSVYSSQKGTSANVAGGSGRGLSSQKSNTPLLGRPQQGDGTAGGSRTLPGVSPQSHASSMHEDHASDVHVDIESATSPAGVEVASQCLASYPRLLAAAMADMAHSASQESSSKGDRSTDLTSPSRSIGGNSAALLAESHSRSWQASHTYATVQGAAAKAAAVKRARNQERATAPSPPLVAMVQSADSHTWMGSYDHSKALEAADPELRRSTTSVASGGDVLTTNVNPSLHAHSPCGTLEGPRNPRARSQASHSQASRSQSLDRARDSYGTVSQVSHSQVSHSQVSQGQSLSRSPGVFRSGAEGVEEKLERIKEQLAIIGPNHLLRGLCFKPGPKARLQGGQAIVQFATELSTESEYAIKFFATREAFSDEAALYRDDDDNPLHSMLPVVRDIIDNCDGRVTDAVGEPLPPCIVMEKGEALNIWSRRNKGGLDHMTALQVVCHVAHRLVDLHAAGYVHRDLKQSNVMWQPQMNRWTLIDFGLVARIGEPAKIGFSLAYAAPEVVIAYRRGEKAVIASEAMDAWSLGVLAVELFTNDVGLDLMQGKEKVISQIVGETALPWEDTQWAPSLLRKFGLFKDAFLELLNRDPSQRPKMHDFTRNCRQILALTKSQN